MAQDLKFTISGDAAGATQALQQVATQLQNLTKVSQAAGQATNTAAAGLDAQQKSAQKSIAMLEKEVAIQKQVKAGTLSSAKATEELARARAGGDKKLGDLLAKEAKLKKELEEGKKATEGSTTAMGKFGAALSANAGKLGAAAVAVAALAAAYKVASTASDLFFQGISRLDKLEELSTRSGVSVEQLSKFTIAAETAGVGATGMTRAVQILSKNMVDAADGLAAPLESFEKLGIEVKNTDGTLRDAGDVMLELGGAFRELGPGAERTGLAMKVMGKSGAEMLSMLSNGEDAMARFIKLSDDLGLTVTRSQAEMADSIDNSMTILGQAMEGIATQFAIGLGPGVDELGDALVELVASAGIANGGIQDFGASVGEAFATAADSIDVLRERIAGMDIGEAFGVATAELGAIAATAGIDAAGSFVSGFSSAFFTARNLGTQFSDADLAQLAIPYAHAGEDAAREFTEKFGQAAVDRLPAELKSVFDAVSDADIEAALNKKAESAGAAAAAAVGKYVASLAAETSAATQAKEANDALQAAVKAAAEAVDAATTSIDTNTSALSASNTALSIEIEVYEAAAEAGLSLAEAQLEVARALVLSQAAAKEELGVAGDVVEAWREEALAQIELKATLDETKAGYKASEDEKKKNADESRKLAEEEKKLADAFEATVDALDAEADALRVEIDAYKRATAAGLSLAEAEKAVAVALIQHEAAQKLLAGQSPTTVANWKAQALAVLELQDELDGVKDKFKESEKAAEAASQSFLGLGTIGDGLLDGVNQAVDGFIAGTLEMEDVAKSAGIAIGKNLFNEVLVEKFKFDDIFSGNILDLGGQVVSVLGGAFSSVFGGASSGSGGISIGGVSIGSGSSAGGGINLGGFGGGALLSGTPLRTTTFTNPALTSSDQTIIGSDVMPDGSPAVIVQNGDGSTTTLPMDSDTSFQWGSFISNAGQGALAGYGATQTGIGGPRPVGNRGFGNFGELISNQQTALYETMGTILGAIFGGLGGAANTLLGDLVFGSAPSLQELERGSAYSTLQQRHFDPLGAFWTSQFIDIPTRGNLVREPAADLLNESAALAPFRQYFGAGFNASAAGDLLRPVGEPTERLDRSIAARGLSQGTIDQIRGEAEAVFSVIGEGFLDGSDAGKRFYADAAFGGAAIFLETFSSGVAEGDLLDSDVVEKGTLAIRAFAKENGISLLSVLRKVGDLQGAYVLLGNATEGMSGATALDESFQVFGRTVAGSIELFETDFPRGTQVGLVALQTMTKDGEQAFENLSQAEKEALVGMMDDFESTSELFEELARQGFDFDTTAFDTMVSSAAQSAEFIGANFLSSMTAAGGDAATMLDKMMIDLSAGISDTFLGVSIGQLFDTTAIGQSFQPVYAALDKINDFDLTTATGVQGFRDIMMPALAEGRENFAEYIPIIKELIEAAEEFDKQLAEALQPDPVEEFFNAVEARVGQIESNLTSMFQSSVSTGIQAIRDAIAEGVSPAEALDAGVDAFVTSFSETLREQVTNSIVSAMVEAAVFETTLAPLIAELELKTAAAMEDGVIDATEQAELTGLAENIIEAGENAARELTPVFEEIGKITLRVEGVEFAPGTLDKLDDAGLDTGDLAAAGVAKSTRAIVGEAGQPELVTAVPGGFRVTPMTKAGASNLMRGHRVPGLKLGFRPHDGHTPDAPPGPPKPKPVDPEDYIASFNIGGSIEAFVLDGIEAFAPMVKESIGQSILSGVMQGFQDSAVAKDALKPLQEELARAMSDGILSEKEAESLAKLGKEAKNKLTAAVRAMGPAFDIIAEQMGLKLEEEVIEAIDPIKEAFDNMIDGIAPSIESSIGGALQRGLLDGTINGATDLSVVLKATVGNAVLGALVNAFVTSGALGAQIQSFASLAAMQVELLMTGVLTQAQFDTVMKGMTSDFINNVGPTITIIADALAPLQDFFSVDIANTVKATIDPIIKAGEEVVDGSKDVCGAKCDLIKETVDLGDVMLDIGGGRTGSATLERWVPRGEKKKDGGDEGGGDPAPATDEWDHAHLTQWRSPGFGPGGPKWFGGLSNAQKATIGTRELTAFINAGGGDPGEYRGGWRTGAFAAAHPEFEGIPVMDAGGIMRSPRMFAKLDHRPEAVVPLSGGSSSVAEEVRRGVEAALRAVDMHRLVDVTERAAARPAQVTFTQLSDAQRRVRQLDQIARR